MRTNTRAAPFFYADELRRVLADEPGRLERALRDECSLDLLVWNVFASLETHEDRDWLAYRLQMLGGEKLRAPLRVALWTGKTSEPLLVPSRGAVGHVRERVRRAGAAADGLELRAPVEVPVRIESPEVLVLVDAALHQPVLGAGGRDRTLELVDAGLEHAHRLGCSLAVAVVAASAEASQRLRLLNDTGALAAALPWRRELPEVVLRGVTWAELLQAWEQELPFLDVDGQPVRAFLDYARRCGLR